MKTMYMPRNVHFTLSNTLIATQNYVNKDKLAIHSEKYAVPVNAYPNREELKTFQVAHGKPRPLKHYRKRLISNTNLSKKVSLSAFETPGGTVRSVGLSEESNGCTHYIIQNNKLLQNNC